jgi:hypothetical protein
MHKTPFPQIHGDVSHFAVDPEEQEVTGLQVILTDCL